MVWGQLNDGYFTTSSDTLWPHITLQPHFTPLVCKLGVIKKTKKKTSQPDLTATLIKKFLCRAQGTGDLKGASMSVPCELPSCQKGDG